MNKLTKVIVFQMDNQQYGLEIDQVQSIERLQDITRVPRTSSFIKGVINLRDSVVPIIDLKERLNLNVMENTNETRILIVTLGMVQAGLIVDSATDVIDIDTSIIEPAPEVIKNIKTDYLTGVAKLERGLLLILNIDSLFSLEEIDEVEEVNEL